MNASTQHGKELELEQGILISADSHIVEAADFMETHLPSAFRTRAPRFPEERIGARHQAHPGGRDPKLRISEMETDGVSAEVIYPSYPMKLFSLDKADADLQEVCFRAYNDWLVEYCSAAPERIIGIGMLSTYHIESALEELARCKRSGMRGVMIWQSPHPDIPFTSNHYDPLWQSAQELEMPVSIHSLTGLGEAEKRFGTRQGDRVGLDRYRGRSYHQFDITNALFDIIFSGVLERFPQLKIVLVEHEIGWIPFVLQGWDRSVSKFRNDTTLTITKAPSEYFKRQVYATFFNDYVGGQMLSWWGQDNMMWSSDYPHPNSTWPHSRETVARTLGHLTPECRDKVLRSTAAKLYNIRFPGSA
jgi:predicted TIM-barrel fold metal-dependent hydrolase